MPELFGIENLKKAVHLAIALPVDGTRAVKSKFAIFNVLGFITDITDLIAFFKTKDQVVLELKDLHPDERLELIEYIKTEFVIADKEAEAFAEDALSWVNTTLSLFERAKLLIKK
jgi:hypothetical protein